MLDSPDVRGSYASPPPALPLAEFVCMSSPPTAAVLQALTQRPHRGPDTSAGARAAVSTQHALYTPRGGTGVEAVTDGLRGLRAQPQHGAPIRIVSIIWGTVKMCSKRLRG